jgi:hypothetical protein
MFTPTAQVEAAGVLQRLGEEFAVNTTTKYRQLEPSVAALSDGGFAVVWTDESHLPPDTSGSSGIRGRVYSAAGAPRAKDFPVNRGTYLTQFQPAATGLKGGGFVAIWTDNGQNGVEDTSGYAVRGQRFTSAGAKAGGQFTVNRISKNDQYWPAIGRLANGGFAAAWDDGSYTGTDPNTYHDVRGQAFTAAGGRNGQEFRANTTTYTNQNYPAVAGLSTGNFVVTWDDISQTAPPSSGNQIRAQVFSPSGGKIGKELLVNSTPDWTQRYSAAAGLANGRFVVAWEDGSHSINGDYNIRAQIMTSAGGKVGPELIMGHSQGGSQEQAAVAGFPNGRFVVVWTDENARTDDPSGSAVRAQVFAPDGRKLGAEFRVNRRTVGDQSEPSVAVLNARDFVVVWTDGSGQAPDLDRPGIRGQRFRLTQ